MEFVTIHDLSRELNVPARVIRYRLIQLMAEGIESLGERITIGKGEIDISFCYLPSCKEVANGWRKGRDSNPR